MIIITHTKQGILSPQASAATVCVCVEVLASNVGDFVHACFCTVTVLWLLMYSDVPTGAHFRKWVYHSKALKLKVAIP